MTVDVRHGQKESAGCCSMKFPFGIKSSNLTAGEREIRNRVYDACLCGANIKEYLKCQIMKYNTDSRWDRVPTLQFDPVHSNLLHDRT